MEGKGDEFMGKHFLGASLLLPPHGHHPPSDDDDDEAHRSSALIDLMAFIADRRNAITARCAMRNGLELPPRVSYFCVWCPREHPTELATEPCIVAAEADLVVFAVVRGYASDVLNLQKTDVFIYQAGAAGASSIRRLGHPGDGQHSHYYIVTLHPGYVSWEYFLYVFDSKTGSWRYRTVSLGLEHRHSQFCCYPSKVIVLGNGGLMAFVDLWRGMVVLAGDVPPRFIHFPRALRTSRRLLQMDANIVRDVVVVDGRVKVADCFWFKHHHHRQQPDVINGSCREIDDVTGRRTLRGLHITRPAVSLNDDDMIYLMAKVDPWDKRGWMIAVHMRSKKVKDVGIFRAKRIDGVRLSYTLCRVSKYFSTSQCR